MDPLMDGAGDDPNEANKIKTEGMQFVFSKNRDNFNHNPCPYIEDGNPDMYSKENMEKRQALRKNEVVIDAINEFMKVFSLTAQGHCSKDEYFRIFMKIGPILNPDVNQDDLTQFVEEDFNNDSADKPDPNDKGAKEDAEAQQSKTYDYLDKDKLFEALFTLADVWVPSTDEEEYKEFFSILQFRLKYDGMKDDGAYDVI